MDMTSGRGPLLDIDITLGLKGLWLPLALCLWRPWALSLCLAPRRSDGGLGHDVMSQFLTSLTRSAWRDGYKKGMFPSYRLQGFTCSRAKRGETRFHNVTEEVSWAPGAEAAPHVSGRRFCHSSTVYLLQYINVRYIPVHTCMDIYIDAHFPTYSHIHSTPGTEMVDEVSLEDSAGALDCGECRSPPVSCMASARSCWARCRCRSRTFPPLTSIARRACVNAY